MEKMNSDFENKKFYMSYVSKYLILKKSKYMIHIYIYFSEFICYLNTFITIITTNFLKMQQFFED